ncbi:hypothetical protein [Arenimonas oryziterrae]|uniref:Uncharacterized protein n=1 Tax=Arenimonas oryziterrae DSM 21050 = YC6267 TaxID=1121015 RepID=A0A091ATC6_9GAMM|nr:hypothetical protein [Arenimonas oryziterrae]KFN42264.1 hypothetical protein N789_14365 [Arenimonas oryziterrae DSM 21050 = YC6267]
MTWWIWLIVAAVMAMSCAFFVMLSLSSLSAYGANYHSFTPRQRFMGKALYLGSFAAAIASALAGALAVFLMLRPLWS